MINVLIIQRGKVLIIYPSFCKMNVFTIYQIKPSIIKQNKKKPTRVLNLLDGSKYEIYNMTIYPVGVNTTCCHAVDLVFTPTL